jgi:hypothetical protein
MKNNSLRHLFIGFQLLRRPLSQAIGEVRVGFFLLNLSARTPNIIKFVFSAYREYGFKRNSRNSNKNKGVKK